MSSENYAAIYNVFDAWVTVSLYNSSDPMLPIRIALHSKQVGPRQFWITPGLGDRTHLKVSVSNNSGAFIDGVMVPLDGIRRTIMYFDNFSVKTIQDDVYHYAGRLVVGTSPSESARDINLNMVMKFGVSVLAGLGSVFFPAVLPPALFLIQSSMGTDTALPPQPDIINAVADMIRDQEIKQISTRVLTASDVMTQLFRVSSDNHIDRTRLKTEVERLLSATSPFMADLRSLSTRPELAANGALPALVSAVALWTRATLFDLAHQRDERALTQEDITAAKMECAKYVSALERMNSDTQLKAINIMNEYRILASPLADAVRAGLVARYFWGDEFAPTAQANSLRDFSAKLDRLLQ